MHHSPTERIGRFRLHESIGSGPNGSVSRASLADDTRMENDFAVKRFLPELIATPFTAQTLTTAARAYKVLDNPRIARLSEFEVAPGQTFTAVEFVPGLDAKRLLAEAKLIGHRIAPGAALALIINTARAVGYAHECGVLHLGLSPTNLIATMNGDVKVTDFGILAATITSRPSDIPRLANRIAYFAPEQLLGEETSPASDVFALAAIAHELITGQRAFAGTHARALAQAILAGPPVELALPRPILSVFDRCFARSPHERFATAQEFADALETALGRASLPGTSKDLATFVQSVLGESGADSAPTSRNAGGGHAEPAIPEQKRSALPRITTPPPIPAVRTPPLAEGATLLGIPGPAITKIPSKTRKAANLPPFGVTIRATPQTPVETIPKPEAAPHSQTKGSHPVTSPPFQHEPTSQIPPELVQDLLNASLSEDSPPPPAPLLNTDAGSELFELPDDEDIPRIEPARPKTPHGTANLNAIHRPQTDRSQTDLVAQRSPRRWLWGVGLVAVAGAGTLVWRASLGADPSAKTGKKPDAKPAVPALHRATPISAAAGSANLQAAHTAPGAAPKPPPTKPGIGSAAPAASSGAVASEPRAPASGSGLAAPATAAPQTGSAAAAKPVVTPAVKPVATPAANSDFLTIATSPPGARVFIDGANQGITPLKVPGSTDRHTIAVLLAGHDLHIAESDGHGALQIPLTPVTPTGGPAGIKVIRCKDKDRYYVFVDGKATGMTCPTERIECGLGPHSVEVYDLVTENRRKWDIVVTDTRLSYRVRVD